jgi:spore coat protein H
MKRTIAAIAIMVIISLLLQSDVLGGAGFTTPSSGVRPQAGEDTIKFSRQGYEILFTHGYLHDIEIVISQEEWDGLLRDMWVYSINASDGRPLTGNYRKATFIYKGPAGDAVIEEVGFRTKGHFNRPYPEDRHGQFHRSHFKIKFNEVFAQREGTPEYEERNQRRFAKQRELELRMNTFNVATGDWDTSQMRELYAYDLMRRAGVNASRTGSAKLTITIGGEKHYFGIYTLIEVVDKSFLTKNYGSDRNDGNLYKCLWASYGPATLEPIDKYKDNPFVISDGIIGVKDWRRYYRPTYDLKTNTDIADHTVLLDFIHNLDTLSGANLQDYLEANFEVDRFLRYLAMNVLIGKWDDYWADGNNYYLYFNNDGKIEFIPCDYDMAFGGGFQLFDTANIGIYEWGNHNKELLRVIAPQIPEDVLDEYCDFNFPLVEKMFEIDEYRSRYEYYLKEFITPANKLFVYSEYEKKFNMLYKLYSPYLNNEMNEGDEMFNDESTREYFIAKTKSIINQLGLNEEDYEIPYEQITTEQPLPVEETPVYEYPQELSFEAKEIINTEYGFSFKHPSDWTDITATQLYEARAPGNVTGLFVSTWNAAWGASLDKVLAVTLREAPVEILATGKTLLPDGTEAEVAEYNATITGWPMHCYSVGVIKDGRWIAINVWNIDKFARFNRDLFKEIANTLTLN